MVRRAELQAQNKLVLRVPFGVVGSSAAAVSAVLPVAPTTPAPADAASDTIAHAIPGADAANAEEVVFVNPFDRVNAEPAGAGAEAEAPTC